MRSRCVLKMSWVLAGVLLLGCGGRSSGVYPVGHDGGAVDDNDASTEEFCQGALAKVELGEVLVAPVGVTTTQPDPDQVGSQDVEVLFHTAADLGFDLVLKIDVPHNADWIPGDYDVPDWGPPGLMAYIYANQPGNHLSHWIDGTLQVRWDDNEEGSRCLLFSLCAQVENGQDGVLQGLRLYLNQQPVAPRSWYDRFGIWLLEDVSITAAEAATTPLADLRLVQEPLIHLRDIAYYTAASHEVHLDMFAFTGPDLLASLPEVDVQGLPFVVKANGERIYLGAFFTSLSSQSFDEPVILVEEITHLRFTIGRAYPEGPASTPDPRADPRITQVLSAAGKLAP